MNFSSFILEIQNNVYYNLYNKKVGLQLYLEPVDAGWEAECEAHAEDDDRDGVPGAGRTPVGKELCHLEFECSA